MCNPDCKQHSARRRKAASRERGASSALIFCPTCESNSKASFLGPFSAVFALPAPELNAFRSFFFSAVASCSARSARRDHGNLSSHSAFRIPRESETFSFVPFPRRRRKKKVSFERNFILRKSNYASSERDASNIFSARRNTFSFLPRFESESERQPNYLIRRNFISLALTSARSFVRSSLLVIQLQRSPSRSLRTLNFVETRNGTKRERSGKESKI